MSKKEQIRWTTLFVTYDQMEAEMIKDLLESGGIQVRLQSFKVAPYPVNIGRLGEIRILVKDSDHKEALKVLNTLDIPPVS